MNSVSLTGTGIIVTIVTLLLSHLGLSLGSDQINILVTDVVEVVGIAMTLIGQVRRGDLKFGLIRR